MADSACSSCRDRTACGCTAYGSPRDSIRPQTSVRGNRSPRAAGELNPVLRRTLHREKAMDVVGVHVRALAFCHDLAARHHDVAIGERFREIVVLLDEEDRHLAARCELADRALDVF